MSISCVVSDIDGTLLPAGQLDLDQRCLDAISGLQNKGILFCLASGRPYQNLYRLLSRDGDLKRAEKSAYICQNGTNLYLGRQFLYQQAIPDDIGRGILEEVSQMEELEILVNCREHCYIHPRTEAFRRDIQDVRRYPALLWEDLSKVPEPYLQISLYRKDGIKKSAPMIASRWGNKAQVVVSGEHWMDITALGVSKGSCLKELMDRAGFSRSQCMAMGDSFNDIEMLETAGISYAMSWSDPQVIDHSKAVTDDAVGQMEKLIENRQN